MSAVKSGRINPARVIPAVRQDGPTVMARVLIAVVTGYRRYVSPLLPPRCRFEPSCSAYTIGALREHGAARGLWLAARRLARCHPFNPGGYDPVPPRGADGRPSRTRAGTLSTEVQGS